MRRWSDTLVRLAEMAYVLGHHAAGPASAAALLSCYASILRTPFDRDEVALTLRIAGRRFPFRMRKCDIFTVGEVLFERQYALLSRLPAAPTIVDAGANVGVSGVWFLGTYPGARLHALEPATENFRLLELNLRAVPGAVLTQAALGARAGRARLALAAHGAEHSLHAAVAERSEEVECLTLAAYLETHRIAVVDLLKLDVEGAEVEALEGLGPRLADVRTMVGEVHERMVDAAVFYRMLERGGFRVVRRHAYRGGRENGVHTFEAARA